MQIKRPSERSGMGFQGDHQPPLNYINMACSRRFSDAVNFAVRKQALADRNVSHFLWSYVWFVADLLQATDQE